MFPELVETINNAHDSSLWTVAWVPTREISARLLTGSLDKTVSLWDLDLSAAGPKKLQKYTSHSSGVVSVAAHPGGKIAASAAATDCVIRVFHIATNDTVADLCSLPREAWQLQFNSQGTMLAVAGGCGESVKLWDSNEWALNGTLSILRPEDEKTGSKKFVLSVAWSPDGNQIACGSMDGTISILDVGSGNIIHQFENHSMPVRSVKYSPKSAMILFSGSDDGVVNIYDTEKGTLISSLSGHGGFVLCIDVSPDGREVITGSSDRTVKLWDVGKRAARKTLNAHTDQVWAVAFGPFGLFTSASEDKSLSIYKCRCELLSFSRLLKYFTFLGRI